ncbi:EamA family transporter [Nocardiopsis sp. LOL_012]|uniref:EamA family transporter n=1 Tax=Nocardiopsis sp. LOL_012 TaxID=3345409 RepID=UPI003A89CA98
MNRPRTLGIAAITATSLLWGTTGTAATFAPHAGPLAIGSAALGIGGLLQALIALPSLAAALSRLRRNLPPVAVGALAVGVYPLAFYASMHLAGVAVGTVVSLASAPLASGLLELAVQRRPPNRWWTLAATLGTAGGALLCAATMAGPSGAPPHTATGIALGLVAGAAYATFSWTAHSLMGRGVDRAAAMGAVFGTGGILLMPVLALTGAPLLASAQAFTVAAYMALVPMFLGYLLFGFGLARVPASTATTVTLSEPALAALLAVLVVGESLSAAGWLGLGLVALVPALLALAPDRAAGTPVPAGREAV